MANENRETVRTYELNLLVTGGWLSALANIRAGCLWHFLLKEKHRKPALASRHSYVGSIIYASGDVDRSEILSPIWSISISTPMAKYKMKAVRMWIWNAGLLLSTDLLRCLVLVFQNAVEHRRAFRASGSQLSV